MNLLNVLKIVIISWWEMKIIKISAIWCTGCLITNKNLKKIKEEYPTIEIIDLDYDMDEDEVQKYNVGKIIPVLIFEKDNVEVQRLVGEKKYQEIKEVVEGVF